MNDSLKINLQIGGYNYPLTINREEEAYYRNAAVQLNNKLNLYKQAFSQEGNEKIVTMVALHFAYLNAKLRDRNDTEPFLQKMGEWDSIIERAEAEK